MAAVMASGGSVGINVLRYSGIAENHHTSGKGRGLLPSSPMQTFSQPNDQEALDADDLTAWSVERREYARNGQRVCRRLTTREGCHQLAANRIYFAKALQA
jgi:hypothetical protein